MKLQYLFVIAVTFLCVATFFDGRSEESQVKGAPGLQLTLHNQADNTVSDTRRARFVALRVNQNQAASPFLKKGPFTATWAGYLNLESRSKLRFSLEGRGAFKLTIDDKLVFEGKGEDLSTFQSERKRFKSGARKFLFEYTSPDKGDAQIRLHWDSRDIFLEPIPPKVFSFDASKELKTQQSVRQGREIFASHRCLKCHQAEGLSKESMPELAMDSPDLTTIGSRVNSEWLAHWIANPKALRPEARMPSVLGYKSLEEAASAKDSRPWDIAAYLASLGKDSATAKAQESELKAGGNLFAPWAASVAIALRKATNLKRDECP